VDTKVTATYYCLTDEMLQASGHTEPWERTFSDAEAGDHRTGGGRHLRWQLRQVESFSQKRWLHAGHALRESQFNRRLHKAAPLLRVLFSMLAEVHKKRESESEGDSVFLVDSFPMPVCSRHPNRSVQALPKRGVSPLHGQQTAILLRAEDPCDGYIER
jgi:hypothetical protein